MMDGDKFAADQLAERYAQPRVTRMRQIAERRAARMHVITTMINDGFTIEAIADKMGIKTEAVTRLLRVCGVTVPGIGPGNYSLLIKARRVSLPALDRLAEKWTCSRSEAAGRILSGALLDHGRIAQMALERLRSSTRRKRGRRS